MSAPHNIVKRLREREKEWRDDYEFMAGGKDSLERAEEYAEAADEIERLRGADRMEGWAEEAPHERGTWFWAVDADMDPPTGARRATLILHDR